MGRWLGVTLAVLSVATVAVAQEAAESARALLAAWHRDPARIERARVLLERQAAVRPTADVLVELSRAWFLTGEALAHSAADKTAAYEQGREVAQRAVAIAPDRDTAHLWLAINTGRFAESRGRTTGLTMLPTIRASSETVLRLNPDNVDGLILAGGILANVPRLMGGDRGKAEAQFKRALEIDPHKTAARLELAELYVDTRRWANARQQVRRLLDEPSPTDVPRWTVTEVPRARVLLAEIIAHEPRAPEQSP